MSWWQQIPEHLDPIAFTVGFFSVRWYALFFAAGFLAASAFIARRRSEFSGFLLPVFLGALIGGRLGYVLFYAPAYFLESPLRIIMPYDAAYGWIGISGMSFHGGLIGAAVALAFFTWKRGGFLSAADEFALAAPIALFFGRIGNFLNLELYGRLTDCPWGMAFPGVWPFGALRHPSTLYETALEGIALFVLLWTYRRRSRRPGEVAVLFLVGYSAFRFIAEYFREPDQQLGYLLFGLSMGQWLSLALAVSGLAIFWWLRKRDDIIP